MAGPLVPQKEVAFPYLVSFHDSWKVPSAPVDGVGGHWVCLPNCRWMPMVAYQVALVMFEKFSPKLVARHDFVSSATTKRKGFPCANQKLVPNSRENELTLPKARLARVSFNSSWELHPHGNPKKLPLNRVCSKSEGLSGPCSLWGSIVVCPPLLSSESSIDSQSKPGIQKVYPRKDCKERSHSIWLGLFPVH